MCYHDNTKIILAVLYPTLSTERLSSLNKNTSREGSTMLSHAEISDLLHEAPKVFSRMFNQLMLGCFISHRELARKGAAFKQELVDAGKIKKSDSIIGAQYPQTVDSVADSDQRPTHGQLRFWLDAIADWCNDDPGMLAKIAKIGPPAQKPRYPHEVEQDLYRLALYGTIDEIEDAYERWKDFSLLEYLEETRHMQADLLDFPNTDKIQSYPQQVCKPELQH